MKNKLLLFVAPVLAVAWFCTLSACKKDPPPNPGLIPIDYTVLPEATQEGKNTFGCLVDGEVWVPRVELFVPWYDKAASLHENDKSGIGNITCRVLTENQDDFMQLVFGPTLLVPGYYAGGVNSASIRIGTNLRYISSPDDSSFNQVHISKIDTIKNFVSGTFQFILKHPEDANKKITLTNGRFDMPYFPE